MNTRTKTVITPITTVSMQTHWTSILTKHTRMLIVQRSVATTLTQSATTPTPMLIRAARQRRAITRLWPNNTLVALNNALSFITSLIMAAMATEEPIMLSHFNGSKEYLAASFII
jgi:hypothetical protein